MAPFSYTPLLPNVPANHVLAPRRRLALALVVVAAALCALAVAAWRTDRYSPLTHYQHLHPPPLLGPPLPANRTHRRAVISTLYSDSYALAAAVLAHSYLAHHPHHTTRLLLPYLPARISPDALCVVRAAGWEPLPVPLIPPPHHGKGIYHRFVDQYTKLNIWDLPLPHNATIDKAVYLDADTLVRASIDELFDLPYTFAAVPDVYTDAARSFTVDFNAGVLVFTPSPHVFSTMKHTLQAMDSDDDAKPQYPLDQAEQAFLNLFFAGTALRLPYAYNANLAIKHRSPALWASLTSSAKIVHYTLVKPFNDIPLSSLRGPPSSRSNRQPHPGQDQSMSHARRVLSALAAAQNAFWADEVAWWARAFEEMMAGEVGRAVRACLRDDGKVKEPIRRTPPRSLWRGWGASIPKEETPTTTKLVASATPEAIPTDTATTTETKNAL